LEFEAQPPNITPNTFIEMSTITISNHTLEYHLIYLVGTNPHNKKEITIEISGANKNKKPLERDGMTICLLISFTPSAIA
jgi:hypothetical protein